MAFGIFGVSSHSLANQLLSKPEEEATEIFKTWGHLYLSHSEFAKNLNNSLTESQKNLFIEISKKTYECSVVLEVQKSDNDESKCLRDLMKNYDKKDTDDLIRSINKLKIKSNYYEVRDVSWQYNQILRFHQHLFVGDSYKLLANFTNEEKSFIEILISKHNHWFYHYTDVTAFENYAEFWKDDEMFHRVYHRIEEIEIENKQIHNGLLRTRRNVLVDYVL